MTKAELKPVMTTQEVAKTLGLSSKEVRRLEERGVIKRLRGTKNPIKFSGHQIDQWLKGE